MLILVGASVRAAAFSAVRRGWRPWCADLFGDADLRRLGPVRVIPRSAYPHGIPKIVAEEAPDGLLQYTGGLENHPDVVAELARLRPLWGNPAQVLRRVRHPLRLAEVLGDLYAPTTLRLADVPCDGAWLAKPLRGCGGRSIEAVTPRTRPRRGRYYQQRLAGISVSAVFLADACNGCRLLGATRQLVGEPWLYAKPFAYCGSVGPMPVNERLTRTLIEVGQRLHTAFGLIGYFGVDGILDQAGQYRVVEVNPRYTASVEVLEYADSLRRSGHAAGFLGKAVLYAPAAARFPAEGPWSSVLAHPPAITTVPDYADIPNPGTPIEAGQPILTLFAAGDSEAACLVELRQRAEMLDCMLYGGKMLVSRGTTGGDSPSGTE